MILLIDNYDSFTYNVKQEIEILGEECLVIRNDQIDLAGIRKLKPECIVISPGPGNPDSAGISLAAIREFAGEIPIFGVCLGHQSIGQALGAKIVHARKPKHGKISKITHDGKGIFEGLPNPVAVARYHSLVIDPTTLPETLEVTATSEEGEIMAVRSKTQTLEGVQFHPESIATEEGRQMMKNFFTRMRAKK